jgi:hypothetical protein
MMMMPLFCFQGRSYFSVDGFMILGGLVMLELSTEKDEVGYDRYVIV